MTKERLEKYANLLVKAGGNVQKGQLVVIVASVDDAYFVRMVMNAAYDAGASEVVIDWNDEATSRAKFMRGADDIFDTFPKWRVEKYKEQDDNGAVYLRIESSDPDYLSGVNPTRLQRFAKVSSTALKPHAQIMMSSTLRWSILAIPSPAWAKKVFPNLSEADAMAKLWEYILKGARADGEDPVADWHEHNKNFTKRINYLNTQNFDSLRFTTGLGTNITLGLVNNHVWEGGSDTDKNGTQFFPNLPTEEIFTMPNRNRADGRVVASMPLSYQGNLIENFELTFKDGRVVDYKA